MKIITAIETIMKLYKETKKIAPENISKKHIISLKNKTIQNKYYRKSVALTVSMLLFFVFLFMTKKYTDMFSAIYISSIMAFLGFYPIYKYKEKEFLINLITSIAIYAFTAVTFVILPTIIPLIKEGWLSFLFVIIFEVFLCIIVINFLYGLNEEHKKEEV